LRLESAEEEIVKRVENVASVYAILPRRLYGWSKVPTRIEATRFRRTFMLVQLRR
jgi:hypothetical protein